MEAYLKGEERALDVLFRKYLRPIYGYTSGIVGRDEADDAVQETFLRAWRHLSSYDTSRAFKTWLYRIAHNAAIDLLKKKRPTAFSDLKRDEEDAAFEDGIEDETETIEKLMDREVDVVRVRAVLARLPIKQRTVIDLRYVEELTFAEIGETLDEPLDTVKSRHRRALLALKDLLEP